MGIGQWACNGSTAVSSWFLYIHTLVVSKDISYEGHLSSYRQLLNQTGSTPLFILNLKSVHRTNENKLPWPLFLNFIITLIIFLSESCLSKSERFLNLIKKETLEVIFYLPIPNDILGMMSYIKLKKMPAMLNLVYL